MERETFKMYAILDIETTGGDYDQEGITEIAIYQYDGNKITDQFCSLINPKKQIQPFVKKLTGINEKMLRNAPVFFEVAKRIVEITKDCIIVAHNAAFDYRILKTEFKRLGYAYERETICTINLSKELLPDQKVFSLGKLASNLGIPFSERHRAFGDAQASVQADWSCRVGLPVLLLERTVFRAFASNIFFLTVGVVSASGVVNQTEPHHTPAAPIAMQAAICPPVAMPPAASTNMSSLDFTASITSGTTTIVEISPQCPPASVPETTRISTPAAACFTACSRAPVKAPTIIFLSRHLFITDFGGTPRALTNKVMGCLNATSKS